MSSFPPTTPTLPSYNPVRWLSIPYQTITHGLFRRFSCDTAVSHDKDEEDHLLSNSSRERKSCVHNICGYVALALVSLLLGLVAGHFIRVEDNLNRIHEYVGRIIPRLEKFKCIERIDTGPYDPNPELLQDVFWNENRTFADVSSKLTEIAWASLIPQGRGFIKHPRLSSNEMKSVSAFHEIHCLVSLTQREQCKLAS
jgi:hypothetical protein